MSNDYEIMDYIQEFHELEKTLLDGSGKNWKHKFYNVDLEINSFKEEFKRLDDYDAENYTFDLTQLINACQYAIDIFEIWDTSDYEEGVFVHWPTMGLAHSDEGEEISTHLSAVYASCEEALKLSLQELKRIYKEAPFTWEKVNQKKEEQK
jgi:hypothetical protein